MRAFSLVHRIKTTVWYI